MKNALLACIIIITAIFISIHEVKHINHNDSSSCQICTLANNLVSSDAVNHNSSYEIFVLFEAIPTCYELLNFHLKKSTNHSTAPPKIS